MMQHTSGDRSRHASRLASASLLALLCALGAPALAQPAIDAPAESPAPGPDDEPEVEAEPIERPSDEPDEDPDGDEDPDEVCLDFPCGDEFPFDLNLLFNVGYMRYDLSALNTTMQAKGYSPFSEHMVSVGGSMQFVAWNLLTEFEGNVGLTAPTLNNEYFVNMTAGNMLFNIGYQFKPTPNLRIYPLVGIGMGMLDMSFTRRSVQPSFDEFLSNPGRQGRIGALMLSLNAALGLDWRWDWGFQVGLRGGYLWTPPSNWWSLTDVYSNGDDSNNQRSYPVAGGPNISLSGPYLKLMVGF